VDLSCESGAAIPIEERDGAEVLSLAGTRVAPEGVRARYPAFDVTPARYVSAIVTDRGVCRPPYAESLAAAVRSRAGVAT
jgi:methylthioribose-1-phosphate isomerase